jgi:hypothetical protein
MENTTLSIAHHVFLTRDERYALHNKEIIKTIGVSLPIWFCKGSTSEPGEEVFCEYILTNEEKKEADSVIIADTGYKINIPQVPKGYVKKELSNEEWREMTMDERRAWYSENMPPLSSSNLLDKKDLGGKYLTFKVVKKKVDDVSLIHFVVIKDWAELAESVTI